MLREEIENKIQLGKLKKNSNKRMKIKFDINIK
jgi:hypothetical protein